MKAKFLLAPLAALFLLFPLAACGGGAAGSGSEASGQVSVADINYPVEVGGVTLRQKPRRVVSLSPGLTEILGDLGESDRLAAVGDYCDYPGDAAGLPKAGPSVLPDVKAVGEAAADLVLTAGPLPEAQAKELEKRGIAVAVIPRAKTPEDLKRLYQDVGRALDGEVDGAEKGGALYDAQRARLDKIRAAVQAAGESPQVCYLRRMPLTVATGDTFEGALLEAAGFENSAAGYADWLYPDEKKVELMPDVIFFDRELGLEALAATDVYNTTPAYRGGRCFELDMEVFERQSSRTFDLLEDMAEEALGEG